MACISPASLAFDWRAMLPSRVTPRAPARPHARTRYHSFSAVSGRGGRGEHGRGGSTCTRAKPQSVFAVTWPRICWGSSWSVDRWPTQPCLGSSLDVMSHPQPCRIVRPSPPPPRIQKAAMPPPISASRVDPARHPRPLPASVSPCRIRTGMLARAHLCRRRVS